jgi:hypothetical protein
MDNIIGFQLIFQRTQVKKNYTDDADDILLEEIFEKGQKWNIEQKFAASDNYQGKFVEELTSNGLYSIETLYIFVESIMSYKIERLLSHDLKSN